MKKILVSLIICLGLSSISYSADYYFVGVDAFNKGAYDKAYSNIYHAIKLNPKNVNARYYLAQIFIKQNRIGDAVEQYNRIIFLAPDSDAARLSQKGLYLISTASVYGKQAQGNLADEYKDNYLDYVLTDSGKISKWHSFPVKVYIEKKRAAGIAQNAFSQWQSASKGLVKFNYVASPSEAQITVFFKTKLESTSTNEKFFAGFSTPSYDRQGYLSKSEIKILTVNPETNTSFDDNFIYASTLHEIGHSLGFAGHSPNENDVMASTSDKPKIKLTKRDLNTLNLLYRLNSKALLARTSTVGDLKLKQAQNYIKLSPEKYIGWSNLGDIYFNKKMYSQAIINYKKAISIEPDRAEIYNSLGAAYRMSGDKENAYLNFKKAHTLEPDNEIYTKQYKSVAEALGRK